MNWLLLGIGGALLLALGSKPASGEQRSPIYSATSGPVTVDQVRQVADAARAAGLDPYLATARVFWPGVKKLAGWLADRGQNLTLLSPQTVSSKIRVDGDLPTAQAFSHGVALPVDLWRSGLTLSADQQTWQTRSDGEILPLTTMGLAIGTSWERAHQSQPTVIYPVGTTAQDWRLGPPRNPYTGKAQRVWQRRVGQYPDRWGQTYADGATGAPRTTYPGGVIREGMTLHVAHPIGAGTKLVGKDYEGHVGAGAGAAAGSALGPGGAAIASGVGGLVDSLAALGSKGQRVYVMPDPQSPPDAFAEYWSTNPQFKPAAMPKNWWVA